MHMPGQPSLAPDHSHLLEIVKQSEGEYLTFLAYCSIFQMTNL